MESVYSSPILSRQNKFPVTRVLDADPYNIIEFPPKLATRLSVAFMFFLLISRSCHCRMSGGGHLCT